MAIADNPQIQAYTSPDTSGFASKNGWGSSLSFPVGVNTVRVRNCESALSVSPPTCL